MKCPICGGDMTKGFNQCRDDLYWSDRERLVPALPPLRGESLCLASGGINGSAATAWLCRACRKILVEVPESRF